MDVLCDYNQIKTDCVYCFHEIPGMSGNFGHDVNMSCQAGDAKHKAEADMMKVFSILTTIVLEKSCKIPYVDPATISNYVK